MALEPLSHLSLCVHRLGDLPVDSVIPDDLFTVKRARDMPDDTASRADDLLHKVFIVQIGNIHYTLKNVL